jgi:hypothetical protein
MNLRRLTREPLVHFLVAGGVLFAGDRAVRHGRARATQPPQASPAEARGAKRIVVTEAVRQRLVDEFTRAYGHAPSSQETTTLVEGWIDEEVLYREGVARGLERDDPGVRRRVAQQMSFVLEAAALPPEPTDAELRSWFSANADKWATSELVDFTQVYVEGSDLPASERATALLAQLRGGADPSGLGDVFPGGRRYRRRTLASLEESFGAGFTEGIALQKTNTWELRRSRFGHHLVRIDGHSAATAPDLDAVRADVKLDWLKAKRAELQRAGVAGLRQRWTIEKAP